MLSEYAGIRKWRVRKHLLPKGFGKLCPEDLQKYARALDITTDQLKNPEFLANTLTDRKELND